MPEPTVVVPEEDEEPEADADPAAEAAPPVEVDTIDPDTTDPSDVQQAEAVVEEDDFDDGGLFSGVEDSTHDTDEPADEGVEDAFEDAGMGAEEAPEMGQPDLASSGVATTINEGAARLAVVGLEEPEKSDLEEEFTEVFEAFGLGKNGARFADEYLMIEGEEVDPAWALASTAMTCALFALYMRPDRDEQMDKIASAVGGIGGGSTQLNDLNL